MTMSDERLNQIQDEIMREMDKEENKERELESMARDLAEQLSATKKAKVEVEGRELIFNYRQYYANGQEKLFMTVANPFMYNVGREKYKPYMVDVEMDNSFSLYENLVTVCEAFLRHILGMVKAEELTN